MFKPIKSNQTISLPNSPVISLQESPPTTAVYAAGDMADATALKCIVFFLNLISCCFNRRKMLAAIITLLILIVADVILIVIAYKSHMLQSMSKNGVTMTAILAVPILGAILSCWLRKPGPQDEDLAGALRRPAGTTTIAICLFGAFLIFFLYYLVFYWT